MLSAGRSAARASPPVVGTKGWRTLTVRTCARTLVSIRQSTSVEGLAGPSAVSRAWPLGLSLPLPSGRGIEQRQAFADVDPIRWSLRRRRDDTDDIASLLEPDLITGPEFVTLGEYLGDRHLQLARYSCHVTTVARTISLSHRSATKRLFQLLRNTRKVMR